MTRHRAPPGRGGLGRSVGSGVGSGGERVGAGRGGEGRRESAARLGRGRRPGRAARGRGRAERPGLQGSGVTGEGGSRVQKPEAAGARGWEPRGSGGSSARVAQQPGSSRSPSAFLPSKMSLLQQPAWNQGLMVLRSKDQEGFSLAEMPISEPSSWSSSGPNTWRNAFVQSQWCQGCKLRWSPLVFFLSEPQTCSRDSGSHPSTV
ncbi:rRNA 2'-O-methyltransferase fibrillarin-like [Bubalus bubalis]|uniref:rRNA 2'-O-methyltransferase fibrillarin-like n=1 Tax=Bubalus bubalis TaxID=89462 RepID=UPI001D118408|nr:rRNA 2'-O-methyltransferase fibrillarin-like [Bubalus bubalis]